MREPVDRAGTKTGTKTGAKTAWIYVRESTEEQLSGHSPQTQEQTCRELAARLGYIVERSEWEAGSARSMRERKVWQHYNRAMRQRKMDAIIVHSYSRLHRSFMNQVEMLAAAKRAGVEVLSATEYADPANKQSKLLTYFAAIFNEMESDTIRDRTMGGTRTRALRGMPLVGKKPPYGYRWVERVDVSSVTGAGRTRKVALEPDPVEADRLRALFGYLDAPDHSLADAVIWLNAQGWPSPQGGLWRKTTVRYLINQPLYWGEGEAFRSELVEVPVTDVQGDVELVKRPRLRPADERIKLPAANAPALVDSALAQRVRARVSARAEHRASTSSLLKHEDFWLRGGLLRCGVCGGSMSPRRRTGRADFYVCHSGPSHPKGHPGYHTLAISRFDAETFANAAALRLALDSTEAEAALRRLSTRKQETSGDLAVAEEGLAEVERKLARLKQLATLLSEEDMAEFAGQFEALRRERDGWHRKLAALDAARAVGNRMAETLLQTTRFLREQVPPKLREDILKSLAKMPERPAEWAERAHAAGWAAEQRATLQALGARIAALPARHSREGWKRLRLDLYLPGDGTHDEQLRNGFWPVAVSASHASSTPTISCSA